MRVCRPDLSLGGVDGWLRQLRYRIDDHVLTWTPYTTRRQVIERLQPLVGMHGDFARLDAGLRGVYWRGIALLLRRIPKADRCRLGLQGLFETLS